MTRPHQRAAFATHNTVSDAANDLLREGVWPTARMIRDRLGGGGLTTIQGHLDTWRVDTARRVLLAQQERTPPPAVQRLFDDLWAQALTAANNTTTR